MEVQVAKPKRTRGRKLSKYVPCDNCRVARALVKVNLTTGELWFCRHHFNKHSHALVKLSTKITEYSG